MMTRNELTKYLDSDVEVILRDGTTIEGCLCDCYCNDNLCYFCICDEKVVEPCPFDLSDIKEINHIKYKYVQEVKHGKWVSTVNALGEIEYHCSECDNYLFFLLYDYCPYCGAKMDKE